MQRPLDHALQNVIIALGNATSRRLPKPRDLTRNEVLLGILAPFKFKLVAEAL